MPEKPTYEELAEKIKELEQEAAEHKQAEKGLRESEARYRQALSIAPVGIYDVDFRTGNFMNVNDAVCEYSGYTKDELLFSMKAIDILTKDSQKRLLDRMGMVFSGEELAESVDYEIIKKDGSTGWLRINNRYVYEGKNIVGSTVVAQNITERKRIEDKLKTSEQRFRTLVNAAPYGIQLSDHNGKIIYSNPAHHAIQGYADGELIGKYIWDLIVDEENKVHTKNYYANLIKNELRPATYYNQNRTKDDRLIDVQINWDYIKNTNGEVEGIISIVRDITARKQLEEALRTSEEHLRSLMESATGFVVYRFVRDDQSPHQLSVVFVSPSIKNILGIRDPMNFGNWFEHIHPEDVARITEANLKSLETLKFDEEFRAFNKNKGEWRWIHAIATGGQNEKGWNQYFNGIVIDVTGRYEAYQELKDSEKDLEIKTESLTEMNAALNVLIKNMESKESDIQEQVTANIQHLVLPYLSKIRNYTADSTRKSLLDIVESNLNKITANFTHQLASSLYSLTSTEIKVADLVRIGKTTKEIGAVLNISYKTVESHRERIRKKIGIKNKKINLRSHLLSIA